MKFSGFPAMSSGSQYEFGSYRLDVPGGTLCREGNRVALPPKAAELLVVLVEAAGSVLTREQLLRQVWPRTVIEEGGLSSHISMLRKALGTAPNGQDFIETLPKRGYRFAADVKRARFDAPVDGITKSHARGPAIREPHCGGSIRLFQRRADRGNDHRAGLPEPRASRGDRPNLGDAVQIDLEERQADWQRSRCLPRRGRLRAPGRRANAHHGTAHPSQR